MRKFALLSCVAVGALLSSSAAAGSSPRVEICHLGGDGVYRVIEINQHAIHAHLSNHGDALPATWWEDADGDGFGDADAPTDACPQDGYVANGDDCDDADSTVHPGATDVAYDGIDSDCSSATAEDDLDGDGFPRADDCNDRDAATSPAAFEAPYDGVDNDCDTGTPDDDLDLDGYGMLDGDCNDANADVNPAAIEACGDSMDNDCDEEIDEACAAPAECPCFTEQLVMEHYAAWAGDRARFDASGAVCNSIIDLPDGAGDATYTNFYFISIDYAPEGTGETSHDSFVSFTLDYETGEDQMYCNGHASSWTVDPVTGERTYAAPYNAYYTVDLAELEACTDVLTSAAGAVGVLCNTTDYGTP